MELTLFVCSPDHCLHDFIKEQPIVDGDGRVVGGTLICDKCGARAIDVSMWEGCGLDKT